MERDIVRHGHHRPVRRDALWRQRHEVRVQGRLPRHDGLQCRHAWPGRRAARAGGRLQGDRPRPGDRATPRSTAERVAVSSDRSTRGREMVSSLGFEDFNTDVDSPSTFIDAASKIELSFNWFYADKDNIAFFSSGRVPVRDGGVNMGLPTDGTGKHEWRGFVDGQGPPAGDQPVERADRQLEQQARDGLDRGGRRMVVRLGVPGRPAEQRDRARAGADDARRARPTR